MMFSTIPILKIRFPLKDLWKIIICITRFARASNFTLIENAVFQPLQCNILFQASLETYSTHYVHLRLPCPCDARTSGLLGWGKDGAVASQWGSIHLRCTWLSNKLALKRSISKIYLEPTTFTNLNWIITLKIIDKTMIMNPMVTERSSYYCELKEYSYCVFPSRSQPNSHGR